MVIPEQLEHLDKGHLLSWRNELWRLALKRADVNNPSVHNISPVTTSPSRSTGKASLSREFCDKDLRPPLMVAVQIRSRITLSACFPSHDFTDPTLTAMHGLDTAPQDG